MHTGYGLSTLVGNWQEERLMRSQLTRNNAEAEAPPSPTSPSKRERQAAQSQTFGRTVGAATRQPTSGDYTSVTRETYVDPRGKSNVKDDPMLNLGPRERKLRAAMMKEAEDQVAAERVPMEDTLLGGSARTRGGGGGRGGAASLLDNSLYRDTFVPSDLTAAGGNSVGTRVMKDQDGRPVVRDPIFLAETQIMTKANADRLLRQGGTLASGATATLRLPNPEVPVTLYSEAVASGNYNGTIVTGGTRTASVVSPFNKSCNFSKPMTAYDKVVIDE